MAMLNKKKYLDPEISIEDMLEQDVIMLSDGFNGWGEYDPEDEWVD